ncbi:MAG: hypothetical protein [Bacteriophage sp.]|nr:MAG: hypothetical protein [Bacteriophage sp.]UVX96093.1 MAG: hypothetical protein [Bacteriophage sp.]UVY19965.1 MAG: hypothetical protein [Bacteriophage sp.]UVY22630.1 MAG: hypothetical protein [Bacteriophage sp.]UVY46580.1 MAG: hypothetical protein [Bacteriophage sp.]
MSREGISPVQFSPKSLLHRRKALFLPPIDFFIVLARVAGIEPACLPMGDQNGGQLPCYTRISEPTAQESSAAGRSWSSRPSTFGLGGSDKAFLRSCGVHAQIGFRTVMRA